MRKRIEGRTWAVLAALMVLVAACGQEDVMPPSTTDNLTTTAVDTTTTTEASTTTLADGEGDDGDDDAEAAAGGDDDRDELPHTGPSEAAVLLAAGLGLVLAGRTFFDLRGWVLSPRRRLAPHAYKTAYSKIVS